MPFLETIEKGITKVKDLGEQSRLSGEIAMRENHRKECFTAMGERYYRSLKDGTIPDCTALYREIEGVEREMEQIQRQIQRLRKMVICPGCGAALASAGAFCPHCGAELIRKNTCPVCGAALDPGANFCVSCGNRTHPTESKGD